MQDYILRFDISMDNPVEMDLFNSVTHLSHRESYIFFCHWGLLFKLVIQLSASSYLHDQVDSRFIIEKTVQFNYMGVVQKHLNLQLSYELFSYLLID